MPARMKTIVLTTWILLAQALLACQVPVFRFALERWPADNFTLLVTSHKPLDEKLKEELAYLQESLGTDSPLVNLELNIIDFKTISEEERVSLVGLEHAGEEATLILMPPKSWQTEKPVWVGPANSANLGKMLDSPIRQKCIDHLAKGASVVWILVESGDAEKDAAALQLLSSGVKEAESIIELPEGIIRREDLNQDFVNIDPDNILRSDVPLKISFVIESMSREEAAESTFLPMLVEPEALALGEPLIVPVFGRGRTFGGLSAAQSSIERIVVASEYLCGACSCQVKEGNPGYDLLFKTNWDALLQVEEITADSEIVQQALDVVTINPTAPGRTESVEVEPWNIPWIWIGGVAAVLILGATAFSCLRTS